MYASLAALCGSAFLSVLLLADQLSANQLTGAIAGLAGMGVLGAVGRQILKTYNASQKWQDSTLDRQEKEIARVNQENTEMRRQVMRAQEECNNAKLETSRLRSQIFQIIFHTDHETARKLREILDGGQ